MKRHYVQRYVYETAAFATAECGQYVTILSRLFPKWPPATYRKNHITCGNCKRTKVFKGVR